MSNHCHDDKCSTGRYSHHDECCQDQCMDEGCGCCCHQQKQGKFSEQLLKLADDAWMCLLKEKIREKINTQSGKQLDQLAELISNSNHNRWKSKMEACKCKEEFEDKINEFFRSK